MLLPSEQYKQQLEDTLLIDSYGHLSPNELPIVDLSEKQLFRIAQLQIIALRDVVSSPDEQYEWTRVYRLAQGEPSYI